MPLRGARVIMSSPEPDLPPAHQNSDPTVVNTSSPARTSSKLVMDDMVTKRGRSRRIKKRNHRQKALQLARSIRRNIDLWSNIPQAVNVGRAIDTVKIYESMDESDELFDEDNKQAAEKIVANCGDNKDRLEKVYRKVMDLFHKQKEYVESLSPEEDSEFWREVNEKADAGRNDDTGKLKDHGHNYVLKTGVLDPPLHGKPKEGRGTSHPQIKQEIVPMSALQKYGNDANFDDMIKAKKFKLTHNQAPAFLYDKEMWDLDNMDEGLFRGHFPILILRQVLFGPKAALAEPGTRTVGTRENNSEIAGATKVTPEMIAYSCVHARFYLCKLEQYSEVDGEFNFKKFYYWILKFFEEADEGWVEETLDYWNERTFGPVDDLMDRPKDDEDEDEASFARILAVQKERKARAAAQAPHAGSQTQADSQYTQNAFSGQA